MSYFRAAYPSDAITTRNGAHSDSASPFSPFGSSLLKLAFDDKHGNFWILVVFNEVSIFPWLVPSTTLSINMVFRDWFWEFLGIGTTCVFLSFLACQTSAYRDWRFQSIQVNYRQICYLHQLFSIGGICWVATKLNRREGCVRALNQRAKAGVVQQKQNWQLHSV